MKKKITLALIGVVLSFFFVYILFKNVDLNLLKSSFMKVKLLWFFPVILLTFIEAFLRGYKWRAIFFRKIDIAANELFRFQVIGLAVNNILPFRIGEIVRGFLVAKKYSLSYLFVFSTIVIERLADTIVLFIMFIFIVLFSSFLGNISFYKKILILPAILTLFFLLSLFFIDRIKRIPFISSFLGKHPLIGKITDRIADGALCFRSFRSTIFVFSIGIAQWLINGVNYCFMANAFSINDRIDFLKAIALVFISAVAASLPSMPGYFGNIEFAITRMLSSWNIVKEVALAYAFLSHFVNYVVITILGLFFIYKTHYSIGKLVKKSAGEDFLSEK